MFFAWIWRLEDGRAGYLRPPLPLVGPVWRLGQPLEPGLPSRQAQRLNGDFGFGGLCPAPYVW